MSMRTFLLSIQCLSVLVLFIESWMVINNWKNKLHTFLLFSCVAMLINNLGYLLQLTSASEDAYVTALKFSYGGRIWIAFSLFMFTVHLCRIKISSVITQTLVIINVAIYILILTVNHNRLYYTSYSFSQGEIFPSFVHGNAIAHDLFMLMQVIYLVVGLTFLIGTYKKVDSSMAKKRIMTVMAGFVIEGSFFILQILHILDTGGAYDISMIGHMVGTMFMLVAIFRFDLLGTTQIAKDYMIDRMTEAIIATDNDGVIQYFNEPARKLYPGISVYPAYLPEDIYMAVKKGENVIVDERIYTPEKNELKHKGECLGMLYALIDSTEHYQYVNMLEKQKEAIEKEVKRQTRRIRRLSREMMLSLSKTVDTKDHYTDGHSRRVAALCAEIGRRLNKSDEEQVELYEIGLLHDIGKIGVHEDIINKSTRLTDDEFASVKDHPIKGYEILKEIKDMPNLWQGARWHHEHFDGSGYPDGIKGEEIPEAARITCVADCYDAMTSTRSYSKPRSQAEVRAEVERCKGTWFDPVVADALLSMIDEDKDYEMNEKADGSRIWKEYDRLWGGSE